MDDVSQSTSLGPVKYFGVSEMEGVPIFRAPGGESADQLLPGDIVAAEVPSEGGHARLLDGRGWLALGPGLEEVHPWAARAVKKPGIDKNDAAALAYLSWEPEKLTPLAEHLPLPQRVIDELERRGITAASPIQEAVFDNVLRGKSMCLQSQTGSGKTLAMMLPLLTAMSEESEWGASGDKIIVVTASRELAVQLHADIDSMGFFPRGQGYSTVIIVGNVPPTEAVLRANVIIGTPNELGGLLHKDRQLIQQMNTNLRAIVMDEVDEYTTAPKLFASKWAIKRKRKRYNEQKMTLSSRLGDFDTGRIEWFVKRSLAYSRRKDLQVLAASATLSRNMARKVYRLLRWDPLGRWYNDPPPLMRPLAMARADWQGIPRMPTLPLHLEHRYVQVIKAVTDVVVADRHYTRKPVDKGGLPRLRVRSGAGREKGLFGQAGRPITKELAASLLDGLHDTLKARGPGSAMIIICRTVGLTVRDTMKQLHKWGFHEAEALHRALWEDPKDWPSRWAEKYSYDQRDHASELAERHAALNERTRRAEHRPLPVGSPAWKVMEERKRNGEVTAPVIVSFEGAGRGLHFDGVETLYVLGLPRKPAVYLHMAGRVGRLGQKGGKVVSVLPKRGTKVLDAWSKQIGPGVRFEPELVQRIRSAPVEAPAKALGKRRRPARLRPQGLPLLPEGEEYVPVPGYDETGREAAREEEELLMEMEHPRRQLEDMAARRAGVRAPPPVPRWPSPG